MVDTIRVVQEKYYILNGKKYSVYFPIGWAYEHLTFGECGSGPHECVNCNKDGSISGVFVGYCDGCLKNYNDYHFPRGNYTVAIGIPVRKLKSKVIWEKYPYMAGVLKSSIKNKNHDAQRLATIIEEGFAALFMNSGDW